MIRQFLSTIFRYRLGSVYMLIGYILSFVVLFNGISLFWSSEDAKKATQNESYHSCTAVAMQEGISLEEYYEAARDVQCNVTLYDVPMFSDTEYVIRLVRVGLTKPEGEQTDGCIIGDALEQYAQNEEGRQYFLLDGTAYEIEKVLDGKGGRLSTVTFIPYDLLSEKSVQAIKNQLMMSEIVFESNIVDTAEEKRKYEEALSKITGQTVHLQREQIETEPETVKESKLGMYMCIFAYLFCMINCIVVCEFWLYKRRHEIAVRRAFHFSYDRIRRLLFFDMMKIIAVAVVCYMILQLLLLGPVMKHFDLTMTYDIRSIAFLVAMIPVSAAVTLIPYIHRLKKMTYAAGVKEVS